MECRRLEIESKTFLKKDIPLMCLLLQQPHASATHPKNLFQNKFNPKYSYEY